MFLHVFINLFFNCFYYLLQYCVHVVLTQKYFKNIVIVNCQNIFEIIVYKKQSCISSLKSPCWPLCKPNVCSSVYVDCNISRILYVSISLYVQHCIYHLDYVFIITKFWLKSSPISSLSYSALKIAQLFSICYPL